MKFSTDASAAGAAPDACTAAFVFTAVFTVAATVAVVEPQQLLWQLKHSKPTPPVLVDLLAAVERPSVAIHQPHLT